MNQSYDVVIVGSGAAGLYCALHLTEQKSVCIITKQKAEESDSYLAQGGMCVLRGEQDYTDYFEDTLRAGHYENDPDAVELMIRSSNQVARDLLRLGVRFARRPDGALDYTKEGAHSRPRILFHEDITGQEIVNTLLRQVRQRPNVTILEHTTMLDLAAEDNVCGGVIVCGEAGEPYFIEAGDVVLACGGLGGLYQNSTNFPHITGDALAIALRHHIDVKNLDYVQIHPTTLFSPKPGRRFLISESVRGEGAILTDKEGKRFTNELQPRDLLSKAIWKQMELDRTDYVWEDLRPIGEAQILEHFPNIHQHCLEEGYDVLQEPIPVVPAQHYLMGGIQVDAASRSSMERLYACGETSCNGVHGRNRLASNSLLESLVFAQRAAEDILFRAEPPAHPACRIPWEQYRDREALFAGYRREILQEIERREQDA